MRKILSVLVLLCLLPMASLADTGSHTLETKSVPVYCTGLYDDRPAAERVLIPDYTLYYVDGVRDLPYVEFSEFVGLVNKLDAFDAEAITGMPSEGKADYIARADATGTFTCSYLPQNSDLIIDFEQGTLTYTCMDTFGKAPGLSPFEIQTNHLDFLQRSDDPRMRRLGGARTVSLADYRIPMLMQDGKYLIPLHTAFDLMIWVPKCPLKILCCNGEAIFIGPQDVMFGYTDAPSELGEIYFSAKPSKRSPELARYGYGELCLMLDSFYGLKEEHGIDSFSVFFRENGYEQRLLSEDAAEADQALCDILLFSLDDLHSIFAFPSWMAGAEKEPSMSEFGLARRLSGKTGEIFMKAAAKHIESSATYTEVGNTAYIRIINLTTAVRPDDFYSMDLTNPELASAHDVVLLLAYAHHQINREDSPIKNVVLDLSLCTGGDANAAASIVSWFLGEGYISTENTFTGGVGVCVYRADLNRDHQFTDEDSLLGKKRLFCLTSPITFSSANLTAAMLKGSGLVTMLGQTSQGGSGLRSCAVSGWDTVYYVSGFTRIVTVKNGSPYDADRGVAPDVYLSDPESFYNREQLTEIINLLK